MYPGDTWTVDAISLYVVKDEMMGRMPLQEPRWYVFDKQGKSCKISASKELFELKEKMGLQLNVTQTAGLFDGDTRSSCDRRVR